LQAKIRGMNLTHNLALVGLPGAGKTVVGRQLAFRLGCNFLDSDHVIESRIACPIRDFFELEGEAAFRKIETEVLDDITQSSEACIISTGGGATLAERNRQILSGRCTVVYLHATPEVLVQRLRNDRNRPLLQGSDLFTRLGELYRVRDALYRATAHHTIAVGRPNVPTLVRTVLAQLGLMPAPAQRTASQ
jgi:shikimate kinase